MAILKARIVVLQLKIVLASLNASELLRLLLTWHKYGGHKRRKLTCKWLEELPHSVISIGLAAAIPQEPSKTVCGAAGYQQT